MVTRTVELGPRPYRLATPPPEVLRTLAAAWCPDLAAELSLAGALRTRAAGLGPEALAALVESALAAREGDPPELRALGRVLEGLVRAALAAGSPGLSPRGIDRAVAVATLPELLAAAGLALAMLTAWSLELSGTLQAGTHLVKLLEAGFGHLDPGRPITAEARPWR